MSILAVVGAGAGMLGATVLGKVSGEILDKEYNDMKKKFQDRKSKKENSEETTEEE